MYFGPNMMATSPEVGGTVESHRSPMTDAKTRTESDVTGSSTNRAIATAREK